MLLRLWESSSEDTSTQSLSQTTIPSNNETYHLKGWGSKGTGDGQLSNLLGDIPVDSSGNVYVVDWGNNRVQKFDSKGNSITKWGSEGSIIDNL